MRGRKKATNRKLTLHYLQNRSEGLANYGYAKPKWIEFCQAMIGLGLVVHLYEARRTVSKYVTVSDDQGKKFKVRFSNHAPIPSREAKGDCDFFVGRTNLAVTTTAQALAATRSHFFVEAA